MVERDFFLYETVLHGLSFHSESVEYRRRSARVAELVVGLLAGSGVVRGVGSRFESVEYKRRLVALVGDGIVPVVPL